jgi:NTE family protein
MNEVARPAPRRPDRPLGLVLQGGGALGAFQVGAYEALCLQKLHPKWVAGTSIGAINGAIIAGNPPGRALEQLDAFWRLVSTPDPIAPPDSLAGLRQAYNFWSAQQAALTGQPGFFRPRPVPPLLAPPGGPAAISYYDTSPLKSTLERLVDFDRINAREIRLSLGAVEVETGRTVYFDNDSQKIGPEHVMASGALPPAFPPVEIDGTLYWDGGIVSNTPLEVLIDKPPPEDVLILVVDLWDPRGKAPSTLVEGEARLKNITYASRAKQHIRVYRQINELRALVHRLYQKLPPGADDEGLRLQVDSLGCPHTIDILHLVYEEARFELPSKDYEFSRSSVARHRTQGYCQAERVLVERGWCAPAAQSGEIRIHVPEPLPTATARPR